MPRMAEAVSHLVFASGPGWYAVPAETAVEVVTVPHLTRVPGSPPHLLGVFAHRGEVLPVVDVGTLIGNGSEAARRAVVVRLPKGVLALTTGRVSGVAPIEGSLAPLGASGAQVFFRGPAKANDNDVSVIEPEGLLDYLTQQVLPAPGE